MDSSTTQASPRLARLQAIRQHSAALIAPLSPEDLGLQGMADASPPKWHLGHTTWFFETFLLEAAAFKTALANALGDFQAADPRWGYLFNSYYDALGSRHPRPQRGLLSRPSIDEVLAFKFEALHESTDGVTCDPEQFNSPNFLSAREVAARIDIPLYLVRPEQFISL